MLKALLLARGTFNLLFAAALTMWIHQGGLQGFARSGLFVLVDGLFALALAASLWRLPVRWLAVLSLADGAARLLFGSLILGNPQLQRSPLGEVLFFTAVIFACIVLGAAGLVYLVVERRREAAAGHRLPMTWPAATLCAGTLLLGVGLGFDMLDDERRATLAVYALVLGLTFVAAGLRLGRRAGR